MLRRTYEADWERKKKYLIRSLFHDIPDLSTIRESEELSSSSPQVIDRVFHEDTGPPPDLIIERVPKRHNEDESELFYYGLRKKMRHYYRILFNKDRDGSSSPDVEGYVHQPNPFNESRSEDDDFEPDLNSAFIENIDADNTTLNKSNVSVNNNKTFDLKESNAVARQVDKSNGSEDKFDEEKVSATRKAAGETKNTEGVEKDKTIGSNTSIEENSKENIAPEIIYFEQHSNSQTHSECVSIKGRILPTHPPQKKQKIFLKTNDHSNQSNATTKSSLHEISEENSKPPQVENLYVEKEIPENSNNINTTVEIKDNEHSVLNDAESEEMSTKSTKNQITKEKDKNQNNNDSTDKVKSKEKSIKENDRVDARQDSEKMIIDEVEIMRSHNHSPSTQSLVGTFNSSSSPNHHLERRGEIFSRVSLSPNRESVGLDIATREMDINETSPEDFHPFLRSSTPIPMDREPKDQHIDKNNSPVLHLSSEEQYNIMLKTYIISEENLTDQREERAEPFSEQHVPSPINKTNVTETFNIKEFRDKAVQTDKRIIEQNNLLVDIGIQAEEKEKQVTSVQVQTDEDEDSVLFGRQRIFRRRSNYFIFL